MPHNLFTTARHRVLRSAAAGAIALATMSTAQAALIRVDFQSRVTMTQMLPILGISPSVGDVVVGHFIYDLDAIDLDPGDPTHGSYVSGEIEIEIGGLTLRSAAEAQQFIYDIDGPNDLWSTWAGWLPGVDDDGGVLVDGVFVPGVRLGLHFSQPTGGLTSDAQPDLADFGTLAVSQFQLIQDDPLSGFDRVVLFDDVYEQTASAVPLPATLPLVLTGLGLLAASRRRTA